MKKIGFLSFGHWSNAPYSATRSASDVLLQSIDLAVAATCIHHAEFEQDVGLGGRAHRAEIGFKHFETCHFSSPVLLPRAALSLLRGCSCDASKDAAEP